MLVLFFEGVKDKGIYTFILATLPISDTQVSYTCVPLMSEDRRAVLLEQFKKSVADSHMHVFSLTEILSLMAELRAELSAYARSILLNSLCPLPRCCYHLLRLISKGFRHLLVALLHFFL